MEVRLFLNTRFPTVRPDDLATRARSLMRDTGVRILPVVEEGRIQGTVGRMEILGVTETRSNLLVRDIMVPPVITVAPEDDVVSAVSRMLSIDEWYAPVSDSGRYLGMLGLENVIRAYLGRNPKIESRRVEEIMTRDVKTARIDDPIGKIWADMLRHRYAGIPVLDRKGRLVGIVTQIDLIRRRLTRAELESPRSGPQVRRVMNTSPITLPPTATVGEAARLMLDRDIGRVLVAEGQRLLGIVDREDVARVLLGLEK